VFRGEAPRAKLPLPLTGFARGFRGPQPPPQMSSQGFRGRGPHRLRSVALFPKRFLWKKTTGLPVP
jgi:hypothetical protein